MRLRIHGSVLLLTALALSHGASPALGANAALDELVADLTQAVDERPTTVPGLLWTMARDPAVAEAALGRAGDTHRSLVDTLLCFVSLTEPLAREQLPDLDRSRDDILTREGRPPRWSEVQWQGVQLLRILAPDPTQGRDVRLARELDAAMDSISDPRPAAVNGVVLLLRTWWAERGEDPRLTHDPARIPDLGHWLDRLQLPPDDPRAWQAPRMLADLDRDPVLRERILARLSPERHAHLAAELAAVLTVLPDSLVALGIEEPAWDPRTRSMTGHAAIDLWRIAIETLEIVTGEPVNGADDTTRRLAALLWWDAHRYEARYWRDPLEAPTIAPFLQGLEVPEAEGGQNAAAWARSLYVEPSAAELVLDRLGPEHRGMVAELVALLPLDRDEAHAAGFVMAMQRRSVIAAPGTGATTVPIVWSRARAFVRRLLAALTDVQPPTGLDDPAADAFWMQWWRDHGDEAQWTRGDPDRSGPR